MTETSPKKSDLGVRAVSAVVMVAVAGMALWLGGWVWTVFVAVVALGVLWEWQGLVRGFVSGALGRMLWLTGGLTYIGIAAATIAWIREDPSEGAILILAVLLGVIGTDVGAYFAGRAIGGPKIAPSISPSKTWAGLGGGILGATAGIVIVLRISFGELFSFALEWPGFVLMLTLGAATAVIAQAGDFFESWMKRRAGVKDSGNLIPGHGGLFDRADGMIAVLIALGFYFGLITFGIVGPWSP